MGYQKNDVLAAMEGRYADFYGQYGSLHRSGGEFRGKCPLHNGQRDSFAVNPQNGFWHCHSECAEGGDVFDFLARKEALDFPDALAAVAEWSGTVSSPKPGGQGATARTTRRIVQTYDYTDEDGARLFQVVRYEPKGFAQRRPDESGQWVYSLTGVRRVLYRLPEVMAAVAAGKPVYICEGEKDCDALAALGLAATCNPMGAKKWDEGYTESLCGAGVVILPDNDQDGAAHGQLVAQALHGRARRVRVVGLPSLPEKGDVSDWLAAGGTKEELLALVKQTPDWYPAAQVAQSPAPAPQAVDWEPSVPFTAHNLPAFPLEALPAALGGYVSEVAASTQVPVDMAAMLALSVVAAAASRLALVEIGQTHTEPLNLYVAVVMEPGSRKSATLDALAAPLREAERRLIAIASTNVAEKQELRSVEEKRLVLLREEAAKAKTDQERQAPLLKLTTLAGNLTPVPALPRLLADDVTPEKLAGLVAEQNGQMALLSSEGGIFSILGGRYSDGKVNLDLFLKGHAGEDYRVDRQGRPSISIPHVCLTMGLTVQPDVLASLADTPAFRGRGLLGRFLYSVPENLVGTRLYQNRRPDPAAKQSYKEAIDALRAFSLPALPEPISEDAYHEASNPRYALRLEGPALDVWAAFANDIERRQADSGDLAGIRDWASKLAGAVARIAGGLHLVENVGQHCPWTIPIATETVAAAWAIGKYLTDHALAAYGQMGADPNVSLARRILKWIERKGDKEFSVRDCYQAHRSVGSPQALEPALLLLCERGYLQLKDVPAKKGAGQSASPVYLVNPLTQNTHNTQNRALSAEVEA